LILKAENTAHVTSTWGRKPVSSGLPTDWGKSRELAHHLELKLQKIPLTFWRVPVWTEYLEDCRSGAAWESLGILEIAQQIR